MSRMLSIMVLGVAAVGMTLANPTTSQAQSFGVHVDVGRSHIDFGRGGYYPGYNSGYYPGYYPGHRHHHHYRPQVLVPHGNHYHAVPAYSAPIVVTPSYYSVPSYYDRPYVVYPRSGIVIR